MQLFNQIVLGDQILVEVAGLKRCRLLMNLGLDVQAEESVKDLSAKSYILNEEEKKVNFEKIKALKDP
jgi:hypothetical protein